MRSRSLAREPTSARRIATARSPFCLLAPLLAGLCLLAGCGGSSTSTAGTGAGRGQVIAAENFWGSIASQLRGDKVSVLGVTKELPPPPLSPASVRATPAPTVAAGHKVRGRRP